MSFESNTGLNVSNHYGARETGGTVGSQQTQDGRKIFTIEVEGADALVQNVLIPSGSIVENISTTQTAAVTTLFAGATDISTATWATPVDVTVGGSLTGTFSGNGKVVITTLNVAYSK